MFIHTLDVIPKNWYTLLERRGGTTEWDEISSSFKHIFSYADENPSIDETLQVIKAKIFE